VSADSVVVRLEAIGRDAITGNCKGLLFVETLPGGRNQRRKGENHLVECLVGISLLCVIGGAIEVLRCAVVPSLGFVEAVWRKISASLRAVASLQRWAGYPLLNSITLTPTQP